MGSLKFQAKFCDIILSLYQGELVEEPVNSTDASLSTPGGSSFASDILEILDHANELGNTLAELSKTSTGFFEFSEERSAERLLDIVVLWIGANGKTSVQEIRFTLSDDSDVEVFLKELEARRFEPWPPPIIYAAEKAQYLARLKARGYLEA